MQKTDLTDLELIEEIKKGNAVVLKNFYAMHYPGVHNYVKEKGGNTEDVKDVIQEAMYDLFVVIREPDFVLKKSLHAYFYKICKNIWIKRIKDKARDRQLKIDLMKTKIYSHHDKYEEQVELLRILTFRHMNKLTKTCLKILELYFKEVSFKKITEKLKLKSEGAARIRKKQCLDKLLEYIRNDNDFKTMDDERYL